MSEFGKIYDGKFTARNGVYLKIMEEISLDSVGSLQPHPDVPNDWLISKPVSVSFFEDKELKFIFYPDLENDINFFSDANRSVKNFLKKNNRDRLLLSNSIYKNYRETQDYYDTRSFGPSPLNLNDEEEIWNYVYPDEIFVCRDSMEDESIYLLVYCGCEWEIEHGLQLVFKDGLELTRVSGIDCSPK